MLRRVSRCVVWLSALACGAIFTLTVVSYFWGMNAQVLSVRRFTPEKRDLVAHAQRYRAMFADPSRFDAKVAYFQAMPEEEIEQSIRCHAVSTVWLGCGRGGLRLDLSRRSMLTGADPGQPRDEQEWDLHSWISDGAPTYPRFDYAGSALDVRALFGTGYAWYARDAVGGKDYELRIILRMPLVIIAFALFPTWRVWRWKRRQRAGFPVTACESSSHVHPEEV